MRHVATEASIRRLGVRKRREQLRHSGALKHLLEEFALWTALWTGFPLYEIPTLRRRDLLAAAESHGVESGGKFDDRWRSRREVKPAACPCAIGASGCGSSLRRSAFLSAPLAFALAASAAALLGWARNTRPPSGPDESRSGSSTCDRCRRLTQACAT
jgi:hypothetical protein